MRLALVGDVMLGRLVNRVLAEAPPPYPWGDTLPILQQADWRFCNLECVISDWGEPVSLANNHTLDFEYTAMLDMLARLGQAGIEHAGAGENLDEASRLAGLARDVDNRRVGLLAFTDNQADWAANHTHPGIWYVPIDPTDARATHLFDTVRRARDTVDWLIVSAHWGANWGYEPPPEHIEFGHGLVDAGADLVFGHSAHVVRGVELYGGRLIVYSAGDFIDDYAVDEIERNDQSFVFMIHIEGREIERLDLYPTVIRDCQVRLARGAEAEAIGIKMARLCQRFGSITRWREDGRYLELRLPTGPAAGPRPR
jgi:poly-gamma-glutamate synthesis protein (capsule biosynthesis protein)